MFVCLLGTCSFPHPLTAWPDTVPCKEAPSSKVGHGETVHNLDETGGLEHEDTKSGAPTLGKGVCAFWGAQERDWADVFLVTDTGPREEKLSMRAQGYTEETGTGE